MEIYNDFLIRYMSDSYKGKEMVDYYDPVDMCFFVNKYHRDYSYTFYLHKFFKKFDNYEILGEYRPLIHGFQKRNIMFTITINDKKNELLFSCIINCYDHDPDFDYVEKYAESMYEGIVNSGKYRKNILKRNKGNDEYEGRNDKNKRRNRIIEAEKRGTFEKE